jgi:glycosyltransferase involved in cell wall biosynthesis
VRILQVNKYLYPKGGSETHLLGLADALSSRGHAVEYFGMDHPANVTQPDRTTTVPATDYGQLQGWRARIEAFRSLLFSTPAYRRMRERLSVARPDIAHLHNIYHQLSPSVLVALGEAGVPCVLTAHDYKLVCPSYSLHDGRAECFACCGHRYWNVLRRGCSRKGLAGDFALAVEATVHQFTRVYERLLNAIIAPSRFVRDRLVEGGFDAARICVLPNAIPVAQYEPQAEPGDYLLFVGRLSYEKGLPTLVAAAKQLPDVPLWLVGDGPLRAELEQQAAGLRHVRFLGSQPHAEVRRLLQRCRAVVLPSAVPENCPLSVLEAFASGKPAVATRVGGVPELFEPEPTGITVPPNDPTALADAMRQLWNDPDLCWHLGTQARLRAESRHDIADYVRQLDALYQSLARRRTPDAPKNPDEFESAGSVRASTPQLLNPSTAPGA